MPVAKLPADLFTTCKKHRHLICRIFISGCAVCLNNISLFRQLKKNRLSPVFGMKIAIKDIEGIRKPPDICPETVIQPTEK